MERATDKVKNLTPNNKEFVLMSIEGYKKIANIERSGERLYWTTDINTEIPIKFKLKLQDGTVPMIPKTLPQVLLNNAREYADWPSLHVEIKPGKWTFYTWEE